MINHGNRQASLACAYSIFFKKVINAPKVGWDQVSMALEVFSWVYTEKKFRVQGHD